MRKFSGLLALLMLSVVTATVAQSPIIDSPFGLQRGMTKAELSKFGTLTPMKDFPDRFEISAVSSPHPAFEKYTVYIGDKVGLCRVLAIGKDINTSSNGFDLRFEMKELTKALTSKYGAPSKTYDFLDTGSIWNKPQQFMMALVKQERTLGILWTLSPTSGHTLANFFLSAGALSSDKGFLTLSYVFTNYPACEAEIKYKKDHVL